MNQDFDPVVLYFPYSLDEKIDLQLRKGLLKVGRLICGSLGPLSAAGATEIGD